MNRFNAPSLLHMHMFHYVFFIDIGLDVVAIMNQHICVDLLLKMKYICRKKVCGCIGNGITVYR